MGSQQPVNFRVTHVATHGTLHDPEAHIVHTYYLVYRKDNHMLARGFQGFENVSNSEEMRDLLNAYLGPTNRGPVHQMLGLVVFAGSDGAMRRGIGVGGCL